MSRTVARSRQLACAAIALVVAFASGRAAVAAPGEELDDYDPRSQKWNGLSSFVGLAEGIGFEITPVTQLEWSMLTKNDILVLIYPLQRVDPGRLGDFVQAGGNVVIADDFGASKEALASLGLLRAESIAPHASKFQDGRTWAPIATPLVKDHPLAAEVHEIVTNHPAALRQIEGATAVIGFDDGAVVVAGERGTGRFVAISDPSIFINRMQQFGDNVHLAANVLRWLDRGGEARHVVLLRGDVPMYGDPPPYIDDPRGGRLGRSVADFNMWLASRRDWLLTTDAMKALAFVLAALFVMLALFALPVRRGPRVDGAWLRFRHPKRRDELQTLVDQAEHGRDGQSLMVIACILRDQVQYQLAAAIAPIKPLAEPLYTAAEAELVALVSSARGTVAGVALTRVYRRLRALPSRSQAAAPWGTGQLTRRDFDALYRDVAELCRTLGHELVEAGDRPREA